MHAAFIPFRFVHDLNMINWLRTLLMFVNWCLESNRKETSRMKKIMFCFCALHWLVPIVIIIGQNNLIYILSNDQTNDVTLMML